MNVLVVSCNHHKAGVQLRERLAFPNSEKLQQAYLQWREVHPDSELVVLVNVQPSRDLCGRRTG
jgi:glutamyl-tRNA reductase